MILWLEKNFLTERVVKHWNRLPKAVGEVPFLKVFKKQVDMQYGLLSMMGLGQRLDLILKVFSSLNGSVILKDVWPL